METGFVLLVVLLWLALLMLLTSRIIAGAHISVLISANLRNNAVAEAQVDAAISRAVFQILAHHWTADGARHLIQTGQAMAEVWIENEGGRIDPNVAPASLMQALMRECGATPKAAGELADAVVEWRSLDLLQTAGTATVALYRTAGRSYAPPHKRFVSVDELGLVLGMTPELLACLEPHVSVYSLAVPTLQTASDPVVKGALAAAYPYDAPQMTGGIIDQVAVVRIIAIVNLAGGGRFRRVAVVRVAPAEPNDDFVYRILFWDGSGG